ncbi:hypothetical protein K402DRAFT_407270 [Aulographum hederae CBS 113979]|uniref:Uncharacterized protein n=1 Tax=Aulographum hederae CBS 113979 TaxID=1176131 RepID=A0A6G1GQB4_9PEZI|nr:hypothetical protein K402DRAFT_407270 [Aulographum hederae CBS 113979]
MAPVRPLTKLMTARCTSIESPQPIEQEPRRPDNYAARETSTETARNHSTEEPPIKHSIEPAIENVKYAAADDDDDDIRHDSPLSPSTPLSHRLSLDLLTLTTLKSRLHPPPSTLKMKLHLLRRQLENMLASLEAKDAIILSRERQIRVLGREVAGARRGWRDMETALASMLREKEEKEEELRELNEKLGLLAGGCDHVTSSQLGEMMRAFHEGVEAFAPRFFASVDVEKVGVRAFLEGKMEGGGLGELHLGEGGIEAESLFMAWVSQAVWRRVGEVFCVGFRETGVGKGLGEVERWVGGAGVPLPSPTEPDHLSLWRATTTQLLLKTQNISLSALATPSQHAALVHACPALGRDLAWLFVRVYQDLLEFFPGEGCKGEGEEMDRDGVRDGSRSINGRGETERDKACGSGSGSGFSTTTTTAPGSQSSFSGIGPALPPSFLHPPPPPVPSLPSLLSLPPPPLPLTSVSTPPFPPTSTNPFPSSPTSTNPTPNPKPNRLTPLTLQQRDSQREELSRLVRTAALLQLNVQASGCGYEVEFPRVGERWEGEGGFVGGVGCGVRDEKEEEEGGEGGKGEDVDGGEEGDKKGANKDMDGNIKSDDMNTDKGVDENGNGQEDITMEREQEDDANDTNHNHNHNHNHNSTNHPSPIPNPFPNCPTQNLTIALPILPGLILHEMGQRTCIVKATAVLRKERPGDFGPGDFAASISRDFEPRDFAASISSSLRGTKSVASSVGGEGGEERRGGGGGGVNECS